MRMTTTTFIATSLIGLILSLGTVQAEDTKAQPAAAAADAKPADAKPAEAKPEEKAADAKSADTAATKTNSEEILAIVNGTEIKRGTMDAVLEMAKRSGMDGQIDPKALLDDLIMTELARQEAQKSGLGERDDVKEKVKGFTDKLILNTWMQEKASGLTISDDEIKAAYDKAVASMPKSEYKARHILVKTKEEAQAVIDELAKGKNFADLAKEKSGGPSGPQGGDLGWFSPASMVKPFAEAVEAMEVGTTSKTPVETQFGFHVINLEEKRDVKLPEMESLKPQLKQQLEREKMLAYMQDLRKGADVKVLMPEPKAEATAKPAEEEAEKPAEKPKQ